MDGFTIGNEKFNLNTIYTVLNVNHDRQTTTICKTVDNLKNAKEYAKMYKDHNEKHGINATVYIRTFTADNDVAVD